MTSAKLLESGSGAVVDACRQHGVEVVTTTALARLNLSHGADVAEQMQQARKDIDQAAAVGATSVYTLTGPRAHPDWADNVDAYARLVGDLVDYAAERNIALAVEPTSWLYADLSFVHSFHDSVAFASRAGMQPSCTSASAWRARGLIVEEPFRPWVRVRVSRVAGERVGQGVQPRSEGSVLFLGTAL